MPGPGKTGRSTSPFRPRSGEDAIAALAQLDGTGLTLAQAVALARRHLRSPAGNLTVTDAVAKLIAEKEAENLRERSVRDLRNRLNVFAQTFGDRNVADITQTEVERWLLDLRGISRTKAPKTSPTGRRKTTSFRSARSLIGPSPRDIGARIIPRQRSARPRLTGRRPAFSRQRRRNDCCGRPRPNKKGKLLASVVLGLFAGIRSNEIMRLDWSAVVGSERGHPNRRSADCQETPLAGSLS